MIYKLCAVWDVKARVYSTPFFVRNNVEAMRSFGQAVQDPQSMLGKFPDDYQLHELGTFDDERGRGEYGDAFCLCLATDFRKQADQG